MAARGGEWIGFPAPGGEVRTFIVRPEGRPPWPTLIAIHAASGLDPHHESVTADFAAQGYFTVSPDLYSHDPVFRGLALADIEAGMIIGPRNADVGAYLAQFPEPRRAGIRRAHDWVEHRPNETYIHTVRACYDYLRTREDVGAIGCVGWCMGGRLVAELAATGADLAAGIIYYGIDPGPDRVAAITCPLQGHYGRTDVRITDRVPGFAQAMAAAGKHFAYFIYEAGHGFANAPHLAVHNADAAKLAGERTRAFLAARLKTASPGLAAQ